MYDVHLEFGRLRLGAGLRGSRASESQKIQSNFWFGSSSRQSAAKKKNSHITSRRSYSSPASTYRALARFFRGRIASD